ncbi:lipoprotein [Mycoplasmoides pneumoniae]|uniref:Uncharacterized lipoprotein MG439 homolog 2 n=1 Tax=Mycoplasma pneumoniae (strain ATCC 29342 / M129 / Subtype 1) TaxID=272634 RepID=Y645_MYCPN|nr:MPN647 family lipoprotein [Mycoplasmoides pneumoniae]P75152.1 RecName: Full=Uncharacterized lipoprotein MG439 homolog 2; Flags: Precursor [Mycoplasmoides pneumoniae M129]AAB95845.1 conserved hypothetical protein [Mycoplasmoides pneumoniae M129]AGC04514.1 hypothetical protein C985_0648 [Mycoplasmoides pneumoniae M129-B7]ALA30510.1 hypothetical protein C897_03635 [Mycoplasmoides pneumoniae PI 1428]ALA32615.1 hypothetical protein F533_03635 [Mycoplasmoides pneumoniae 51494]ALA33316.1 hypothet
MKLKLKFLLISLLGSSLLLSACSSAATQVISSLSSAQKYFESSQGELNKKNVIKILKEGYESDANKAVHALLAGWKYTLMDQQLLSKEVDSRFIKAFGSGRDKGDVTPSVSEKGLYLNETYTGFSSQIAKVLGVQSQTVKQFNYKWSSNSDFKVQIQISMKGKVGSDSESQQLIKSFLSSDNNGSNQNGGVKETDFNGDSANFDGFFTFTYTPPTQSRKFGATSFDPLTTKINFPADLQIDVSTTHQKLNTLMEANEQVKQIKSRKFTGKTFDLLPFFYYALL